MNLYKHFGLLTAGVLLIGLTVLVKRWPQTKNMTFSQHAAAYKHTIWYYISLFAIALPILMLFFIKWFVPTFDLSGWFILFIAGTCLTQFACTLVPETRGWRVKLHQLLAAISALFLIPSLIMLLFVNSIQVGTKILISLSLIAMITVIVAASTRRKNYMGWPLQAYYFSAFFIAILAATYTA